MGIASLKFGFLIIDEEGKEDEEEDGNVEEVEDDNKGWKSKATRSGSNGRASDNV